MKIITTLGTGLMIASLVTGCGTTENAHTDNVDSPGCTRLDAAIEGSTVLFKAIPDIQEQAIEDCGEGDAKACVAAPVAVPFTGLVAAIYAPMGFLIGLTFGDAEKAYCDHKSDVLTTEERDSEEYLKTRISEKAKKGDAEAQYLLGGMSPPNSFEKWFWFCQAANQSHGKAQAMLGYYHHVGISPAATNPTRSYVWYKLAEQNGFTSNQFRPNEPPVPRLSSVRDAMTSVEVAEAEKMVAEWKPNPSECQTIGAPLKN